MFDWLFEGGLTVYVLIGVLALIPLGFWVRDRRGFWLVAASAIAVLALVYFLLDRFVETRAEQIQRKLLAMAGAVKNKDARTITEHLSPRFQLGNQNKQAFGKFVERMMNARYITDLTVWDFKFPNDTGKVAFFAKPVSSMGRGGEYFRVEADFVQDADGQWRMKGFQIFHPFIDTDKPLDIPNW